MLDVGVAAGGTLSSGHFAMLVLCSSSAGFGAIGGLSSAINTRAKGFPHQRYVPFRRALRWRAPAVTVLWEEHN